MSVSLARARIDPIPASICADLQAGGYAAYLVGGAVRDLLRGAAPSDWDVATSARPEEILALFPGSLPTGLKYGTVTVRRGGMEIEVTTFRGEGAYSDGRHPDAVTFGVSIEEDLSRRDFTVNAMAYDPIAGRLVDPCGGMRDLKRRILRTVGAPAARFGEDALRMLRLYRLATTLGLRPDRAAERAITPSLLARVSPERINGELTKILLAAFSGVGLRGLVSSGLMAEIIPELLAGAGAQGSFHRHDVLRHSLIAAETIRPELRLRLAALLHDVGKPAARVVIRGEVHFYGHDEIGAEMAREILGRLRYPGDLTETVARLVRLHMFQLTVHPSDASLRHLLNKAGGPECLRDLVELRRADVVATGRTCWQAAEVWRELRDRVEEVLAAGAAFSLRDLAIDGADVMRLLGLAPGPEVGRVLNQLLDRVLEDPALNEREALLRVVKDLPRTCTGTGES